MRKLKRAKRNQNANELFSASWHDQDIAKSHSASKHHLPVSVDEFSEGMANGISGSSNPDGLHHAGVPQLSTAKRSIEHEGPFQFVGFNASHEIRLASSQRLHERIERFLELRSQRRGPLFARVRR